MVVDAVLDCLVMLLRKRGLLHGVVGAIGALDHARLLLLIPAVMLATKDFLHDFLLILIRDWGLERVLDL